MGKEWKGCLVAIVTPFKENGDLDRDAFCENIELLINEGVDGIIVLGCTGESWAVSDDEAKDLFSLAVNQAQNRALVIGGAGKITPEATIRLMRYAVEAGMDGVMVLPPGRVIINHREIIEYYRFISEAVDIPILLYNIPKRQSIDLVPELVCQLADMKNIVAIKESDNDFIRVLEDIRLSGDKIRIFSGHSAERGVPSVVLGAAGWVGSTDPQIMGKEAIDMYHLAATGKIEEAKKIQYRCLALQQGLGGGKSGTFPSFVKYAMNLRKRPGGFPRMPLLPPTKQEQKNIEQVLDSLNLL